MPKNPSLIKNVLLAVDPDTRGAIAYCSWIAQDDQKDAVVDFTSLSLKVFDMPCASVQLVKKLKSGKQAVRRIIDIQAARSLVIQSASSSPGSSMRLQAYVESPPVMPSDSSLATASLSYTHGVWQGLLSMGGFTSGSVPARSWKRDFGLWRTEKDASRQLAIKIFPHMKDLMSLKKHHGRAEALLIAAWGLGVCVDKDTNDISFGPMRSCRATDAYGNSIIFNTQGLVTVNSASGAQSGGEPQLIYADAKSLLDMKMGFEREKQEEKAAMAEKRKLSRKIVKAALQNCKND